MTGDSACRGIRDHDADGTIGLFGAESHEPYVRPPLSKGLWSGKEEARSSAERPSSASTCTRAGASSRSTSMPGRRPTTQARRTRTRSCSSRRAARRGSCPETRATSSTSARSTTTGACAILRATACASRWSAAASSARRSPPRSRRTGAHVTIVFPEPGIGARLFPAELSAFVNDYYREKGVTVLAEELVETISPAR